nr:cytochrome c oxidase subunit 2 [Proechinophthirus fluctus]
MMKTYQMKLSVFMPLYTVKVSASTPLSLSAWGQMCLQDSMSSSMSTISSCYENIMTVVILVAVFISVMLPWLIQSGGWNLTFTKNESLELIWAASPVFLITPTTIFSIINVDWSVETTIDPAVVLKVIGHQWYWSYEYQTHPTPLSLDAYLSQTPKWVGLSYLLTDEKVILPYGVPVQILCTSDDVIHSWALPSLGVKMDCIPGRLNSSYLMSDKQGVVFGQCSEICGHLHSMMPITVEFVSEKSFLHWLASAK